MHRKWTSWIFVAAVIGGAALLSVGYDYFERMSDLPVYGPKEVVNEMEVDHRIPVFELIAEDGGAFNSSVLSGKVVVTNFFFTSCPTVCPKMMRNLQTVHELYSDDAQVAFVSITVDPKRDNPERLREYADALHANTKRWRFLTGEKKGIYMLARNGYFISAGDGDGGEYDFIHSENLVLTDQTGRIRGYYNGLDEKAMDQLSSDIVKLKKERS